MKDRREDARKGGYEQVTPRGMETYIADLVESERCERLAIAHQHITSFQALVDRKGGLRRDAEKHLTETRDEIHELESFDPRAALYDVDPDMLDHLKDRLPRFVREMRPELERSWESALQQRRERSRSIVEEYGDPEAGGRDVSSRAIEPGD